MSMIDVSTQPDVSPATPTGPRPAPAASAARWARLALVCALLVGSGLYRAHQAAQVGALLESGKHSPFPLETLPLNLGPWRGEPAELDPEIARRTGAVDKIFRRYVNQQTGVRLEVIVLYGPSTDMYIHMPEVCYPKAGYEQVGTTELRPIDSDGGERPFRSLVYAKGQGGQTELQEVYYSWRYNGHWSPEVGTQKQFERIPGMYKVHIYRPVREQERRDVGNPCEAFLRELLPELEHRISAAQSPRP